MAQAIKSRAASRTLTGTRLLVVSISTVTGVCYAVLAGLSISAIVAPFRSVHVLSVVIAVVGLLIAFMAFRAAKAGYTDKITAAEASFRGMLGAFIGLLAIGLFLYLFRPDGHATIAHALGRPASSFPVFRVLLGSVLLGFGAGFVTRIRISHK